MKKMQDRYQEIITQEDQAIVQKVESIEVTFFYEEKIYLKIYSKEPIPLYKFISLLGDFGIKVLENINFKCPPFVKTNFKALLPSRQNPTKSGVLIK